MICRISKNVLPGISTASRLAPSVSVARAAWPTVTTGTALRPVTLLATQQTSPGSSQKTTPPQHVPSATHCATAFAQPAAQPFAAGNSATWIPSRRTACRAAPVVTIAQAARATLTLGANLLAVEMPGRTFFEVRQILRILCCGDGPNCPEIVAALLRELDGHAHQ